METVQTLETLIVERNNGVVTVTMNRPERKNAANAAMIKELFETFQEIERSLDDRVMILTGAGGAFCSGADLGDRSADKAKEADPHLFRMRRLGDVALALHRISKPTIAKVDGFAVGAGFSLALGCDLVVASTTAKMSLIFSKRGLSLDNGASWILPRLVGIAKAKELAFFAEMLDASTALEAGLVNRVVSPQELDAFVNAWAVQLSAGPPQALSMTKSLLNGSMLASMEMAVENEARCQSVNFTSVDTTEAIKAFAEKRDPKFIGR